MSLARRGTSMASNWTLTAVNVPAGKIGVLHAVVRGAMNLAVVTRVIAVDIRTNRGAEQDMVEHGIKRLQLRRRAAADLNPVQIPIPSVAGRRHRLVEIFR